MGCSRKKRDEVVSVRVFDGGMNDDAVGVGFRAAETVQHWRRWRKGRAEMVDLFEAICVSRDVLLASLTLTAGTREAPIGRRPPRPRLADQPVCSDPGPPKGYGRRGRRIGRLSHFHLFQAQACHPWHSWPIGRAQTHPRGGCEFDPRIGCPAEGLMCNPTRCTDESDCTSHSFYLLFHVYLSPRLKFQQVNRTSVFVFLSSLLHLDFQHRRDRLAQ